jgi:hypothetical protein
MKGKKKVIINFAILMLAMAIIKYFANDYNRTFDIYIEELQEIET